MVKMDNLVNSNILNLNHDTVMYQANRAETLYLDPQTDRLIHLGPHYK